MSAPRKIWAEVFKPDENGRMLTVAGNYIEADGASIPYHHDDVVRELVEALSGLVALTADLDDAGPYSDGYQSEELSSALTTARAALAKIAQEG